GLNAAARLKTPLSARDPMEAMALCTVMTSPANVAQLLKSEVATGEEAEAAEALGPTLNACLSGVDKAELNRPGLRAVLALAAWRIATAVPNEGGGAD
ncbi:MAG TPA: hypothetical protein VGD23_11565, partial [Sphingomicrobium sp.]